MKKYRPSNGTEGCGFFERWCDRCERDRAYREEDGEGCAILAATYRFNVDDPEYPSEWTYNDHGPCCTAFVEEGDTLPMEDDKTIDMFEVNNEHTR